MLCSSLIKRLVTIHTSKENLVKKRFLFVRLCPYTTTYNRLYVVVLLQSDELRLKQLR